LEQEFMLFLLASTTSPVVSATIILIPNCFKSAESSRPVYDGWRARGDSDFVAILNQQSTVVSLCIDFDRFIIVPRKQRNINIDKRRGSAALYLIRDATGTNRRGARPLTCARRSHRWVASGGCSLGLVIQGHNTKDLPKYSQSKRREDILSVLVG
jgi:hypothetical protein